MHQGDGGFGFHQLVQLHDVFGVHAHASVADAHADAEGLVGAVDQILRKPEIQSVGPERVVRSGADDPRQRIAAHGGLLTDRLGRIPRGIGLLPDDAGLAERSLPALPSDADWPCPHERPVVGVVVDPHLGNIDHQTGTRRVGKHESRRQPNGGAFARQPGVDARVHEPELREPHPETPRDVEQRVLVPGDVDLVAAHHRRIRVRPPHAGMGRDSRSRRREDGCEQPGRGQARRHPPGEASSRTWHEQASHEQRIAIGEPRRP